MTTATDLVFHSKPVNHRVTLIPEEWDRNHQGRIVQKYPALAVEFDNHVARLDTPELRKGLAHHEITVEEVADLLRRHEKYGTEFWQVGDAPGALKPSVPEQTEAILRASVRQDTETIIAVRENERATHNRAEVIEYAQAALDAIEEGS